MSQSIENILSTPDTKKETEYNIITTMNTSMKGYGSLINTITGGGNKNNKFTKKDILNKNQITATGETREKSRSEKRQ